MMFLEKKKTIYIHFHEKNILVRFQRFPAGPKSLDKKHNQNDHDRLFQARLVHPWMQG